MKYDSWVFSPLAAHSSTYTSNRNYIGTLALKQNRTFNFVKGRKN